MEGELYAPLRNEALQRFEANTLTSGIFFNDGSGKFTFHSFPRIVQATPIYAIATVDFDDDGDLDLAVVGNSFSPQPETGHYDGGVGLVLRNNNGSGQFAPLSPADSGFLVPGDAKSLHAVDLNQDGQDDFAIGVNNGEMQAFLRRLQQK